MNLKKIRYKDTQILVKCPVGDWFSSGYVQVSESKLNRLVDLGILKRKWFREHKTLYLRQR